MNGTLGKELRLDLVENHIEKALSRETDNHEDEKKTLKRPASDEIAESEPKKAKVNVNGSAGADSPAPDSVSSSNGDEGTATVSTAAAKLFADIAADILEGEDEEQLLQEAVAPAPPPPVEQAPVAPPAPVQQLIMDNNQQVGVDHTRENGDCRILPGFADSASSDYSVAAEDPNRSARDSTKRRSSEAADGAAAEPGADFAVAGAARAGSTGSEYHATGAVPAADQWGPTDVHGGAAADGRRPRATPDRVGGADGAATRERYQDDYNSSAAAVVDDAPPKGRTTARSTSGGDASAPAGITELYGNE